MDKITVSDIGARTEELRKMIMQLVMEEHEYDVAHAYHDNEKGPAAFTFTDRGYSLITTVIDSCDTIDYAINKYYTAITPINVKKG